MKLLIVLTVALIAADSFQAVAAQCAFGGEVYRVGERVSPIDCTTCTCDGDPPRMRCSLDDNCTEATTTASVTEQPTTENSTTQAPTRQQPTTEGVLDVPCERPIITSFSGQVVHELGSRHAKLRCKATGIPKPTISWAQIKTERRFIDNNQGTLTIKSPRPEDAGFYTCTASNECGDDSIETELVVVDSNPVIVCPELLAPKGADDIEYEGDMSPGTIARFFCQPEHELFGPELTVCLDNGEWNDTLPECLPLRQCPQPKNPPFGQVVFRLAFYRPGDKATFNCKKGYKNVGSSYRVCEETLKWSKAAKPICRKKPRSRPTSCGNPGDIENGIKNPNLGTYSVGDIVSYSCRFGYHIRGSASITCSSSGLWSSPPPTCDIVRKDLEILIKTLLSVLDRCKCEEGSGSGDLEKIVPINLIFVLDKSGSVSNADFKLSLQFVKELVNIFDKTCFSVNVSVVTYSRHAELESSFTSPADLKGVLRNIRRRTYGPTATRRALDMVRDDIIMYNRPCYECTPPTERPPDKDFYTYPCPVCSKIIPSLGCDDCGYTSLFLLTDGKSNWAGDPRAAAKCLKANGVEVFAMGVTSHVNIAELRDIASEPLHSHLYLIQTFEDALKLVTVAKKRFK